MIMEGMTFQTKYSLGQTVYAMHDNKVQEFFVEEVCVNHSWSYSDTPHSILIKYRMRIGMSAGSRREVYEDELDRKYFLTKEELVKSLL